MPLFEEINIFDNVSIKIASPDTIKAWSRGEVKKPETINYRTFRPEKDGLFCERIFGPVRDWECSCGKYKRIKHKGIICDRCGVEVTRSSVRRERMGHITLATPVSHIWFFKATPSRIGTLLGISIRELEKVLYYEEYIVVDPGSSPLKKYDLLNENAYQEHSRKFGSSLVAKMGGEAIYDLLRQIDLDKLARELHQQLKVSGSELVKRKAIKMLEMVEQMKASGNRPEWMVLTLLPVIPPDLRPLVPLDGGRFATSDLNDLYRRVINRNNRLKKLLDLKAPEVIIRNEKRMLQEAVDCLLDNGRHGRPVLGSGNRPLKSLSDMLRGKQGRFRQNLLGKRVDYSGRSVIVIGPELKLNQCGLPKRMALELFEPFIIKKLREQGHVHTIKSAKRMVEKARLEVWDILEDVIRDHPVLLNRAPTLHRLGIQSFDPVLIEGKAIRIHPLVCTAFNADFDGDQMAVHVPLSMEALMEAKLLIYSPNNIFSPADGRPITTPTQDIVLGLYYLTGEKAGARGEGRIFSDFAEAITCFQDREISLHARCKVRDKDGKLIETAMGRILFNQILPEGLPYVNDQIDKSKASKVILDCYERFGHGRTVRLLDDVKELGFLQATLAGISLSCEDLRIPSKKGGRLEEARGKVEAIEQQYKKGLITERERYNKIVDVWTHASEDISDYIFQELDEFNPIRLMADSGARGSRQQIRQLVGMRGLMAKPSGEIIESPITANFREGLTVLEYFISTHGARKGLADTALKTADAGYLTRRLVDVAQDVIIAGENCGTMKGIFISAITEGDEVVVSLEERIVGRVALDNIVDPITDEIVIKKDEVIGEKQAKRIDELGIERIRIRSVLTCEAEHGVCRLCYGRNLATRRLVELGEAVGIIAAQSIGEPGTQLTMRTFHIGGTATRLIEQSYLEAKNSGPVRFQNLRVVRGKSGEIIVLNRNGQVSIHNDIGRELERYNIPIGSVISVAEGESVEAGKVFVRWDPYTSPILTEVSGRVKYEYIREGYNMREEVDETTGLPSRVIVEHRSEYQPQLVVENEKKEVLSIYTLPTGAHVMVKDNEAVEAGGLLAKTPRMITKTKDITGGLPRVAELFEARRPKDPAIISEIDGIVDFGPAKKGQRRVLVKNPTTNMEKEYLIPHGKHLNVYRGDRVQSGQPLCEGPVIPHDILRVCGEQMLQEFLVNEIQEVYRLQGVSINDKHIEVIVRQMLKKVKIEDSGDTSFLTGLLIDRLKFDKENERVKGKKGKQATCSPVLLGITKAALGTESFISAASFQETTRVLTAAAASGKTDTLTGLKENVIMGHLIPAGTGFPEHRRIEIVKQVKDVLEPKSAGAEETVTTAEAQP